MKKTIAFLFYLLLTQSNLFANSNADIILGEWISEPKDGKIVIFK